MRVKNRKMDFEEIVKKWFFRSDDIWLKFEVGEWN